MRFLNHDFLMDHSSQINMHQLHIDLPIFRAREMLNRFTSTRLTQHPLPCLNDTLRFVELLQGVKDDFKNLRFQTAVRGVFQAGEKPLLQHCAMLFFEVAAECVLGSLHIQGLLIPAPVGAAENVGVDQQDRIQQRRRHQRLIDSVHHQINTENYNQHRWRG